MKCIIGIVILQFKLFLNSESNKDLVLGILDNQKLAS